MNSLFRFKWLEPELYLNHINLLPAAVPDLKLLDISLDVLCDTHSAHLQRDKLSVLDLHHTAHLSSLSNICTLTQTKRQLPSNILNNKSRAAAAEGGQEL